jgi:hypothetical protein
MLIPGMAGTPTAWKSQEVPGCFQCMTGRAAAGPVHRAALSNWLLRGPVVGKWHMSTNLSSSAADTSPESTLRLTSIVAIPSELYLGKAPARYTVSAAFSRRPNTAEAKLIQGMAVHERLAEQGYEHVRLGIEERRLEIADTNLEELKSGLAKVIGALVREISDQARHEQQQRDEAALQKSRAEAGRRKEVEELARQITFD